LQFLDDRLNAVTRGRGDADLTGRPAVLDVRRRHRRVVAGQKDASWAAARASAPSRQIVSRKSETECLTRAHRGSSFGSNTAHWVPRSIAFSTNRKPADVDVPPHWSELGVRLPDEGADARNPSLRCCCGRRAGLYRVRRVLAGTGRYRARRRSRGCSPGFPQEQLCAKADRGRTRRPQFGA